MNKKLITILGPTASGKTHLAVRLAERLGGEIISADSRQVYKGMDLGTGKDLEEYVFDGKQIPYHLIDIVEAGESYHIFRFQQDFQAAFQDIIARNKVPVLCGGSGMYLEAVLKGYEFTSVPVDESLREELSLMTETQLTELFQHKKSDYTDLADISTRKRLQRAVEIAVFLERNPDFSLKTPETPQSIIFGLNPDVEIRRERITRRLHQRLQNGMIEEVEKLLDAGVTAEKLIFYGLEYKFITQYLQGVLDYPTMVERLKVAIHQFAKRQMTYFRKMEKDGLKIHWLSHQNHGDLMLEEISDLLERN
ncbi:tRNA dimethylallyltransferase [Pseudarcicella hirudinis]|uniref:tRNA dimethylallyltransferase n=1 Tax=Pseudarcicella hirudinis TaxID=1079859 RepID=A0A1I5T2M8_9BACT|nr:tRNA (adenosine(37)-N6)-dimethylallyltransferase MiaA [Pseudarcicella hirudinis]SFP77283.1 tRNA dimethylallyltransferase [Pseudarcicella hirudinis]